MGLDARFYAATTPVVHSEAYPFDEECWDAHLVVYVSDFPEQADGIKNRSCFVTEGRDAHINQTYSNYGRYRAWICKAMFGVECEQVWANPEEYRGRPFYSQINFSDAEGTLGPKTSMALAKDYAEQREFIAAYWMKMPKPFDMSQNDHERDVKYMVEKYDEWAAAFAVVGETGLVMYG